MPDRWSDVARVSPPEQGIDNFSREWRASTPLSWRDAVATGGAQHQFPLYCGLSIVVRDDGCFERLVIFGILQRADHRLGGEPMADSIAAGSLFAFFRNRTGAFAGIATVGLDLPEGSHWASAALIGFVSSFGPRLLSGRVGLPIPAPCRRRQGKSRFYCPCCRLLLAVGAWPARARGQQRSGQRQHFSTTWLHHHSDGPRDDGRGIAAR